MTVLQNIIEKINKLNQSSLLVIGDLACDEMIYGSAERISREAPVLILKHQETQIILGAAANAAHNASALGAKVYVLGVAGEDYYAPLLLNRMKEAKIITDFVVTDETRPTTTKTRISAAAKQSVTQQIVRIDREGNHAVSPQIESKILENFYSVIDRVDGVLLSDYGIGVLTPKIIDTVIRESNKKNKIIAVDAQKDLQRYKNITFASPNLPEAEATLGYKISGAKDLEKAGVDLMNLMAAEFMLITCGSEGMVVFNKSGKCVNLPAFNKTSVFDVTGAGDTVISTFTLALAAGCDPGEAAVISNLAASIVVKQFGAVTTSIEELCQYVQKLGDLDLYLIPSRNKNITFRHSELVSESEIPK